MNVAYEQEQPAHAEVAVADTLDHDPAELVAQLSHRILLLQQQAQQRRRSENYLSMALSVAAHAAHQHAHGETVAPAL